MPARASEKDMDRDETLGRSVDVPPDVRDLIDATLSRPGAVIVEDAEIDNDVLRGSAWFEALEKAAARQGAERVEKNLAPRQALETFSLAELTDETQALVEKIRAVHPSATIRVVTAEERLKEYLKGAHDKARTQPAGSVRVLDGRYLHLSVSGEEEHRINMTAGFVARGVRTQRLLGLSQTWGTIDEPPVIPDVAVTREAVAMTNDHEAGHLVSRLAGYAGKDDDHLEECRADGFSIVRSVLRTGTEDGARLCEERRDAAYVLNGRTMHWTSYLTDHFIAEGHRLRAAGQTLETADPFEIMKGVQGIVERHGLTRDRQEQAAARAQTLISEFSENDHSEPDIQVMHARAVTRFAAARVRDHAMQSQSSDLKDWVEGMQEKNGDRSSVPLYLAAALCRTDAAMTGLLRTRSRMDMDRNGAGSPAAVTAPLDFFHDVMTLHAKLLPRGVDPKQADLHVTLSSVLSQARNGQATPAELRPQFGQAARDIAKQVAVLSKLDRDDQQRRFLKHAARLDASLSHEGWVRISDQDVVDRAGKDVFKATRALHAGLKVYAQRRADKGRPTDARLRKALQTTAAVAAAVSDKDQERLTPPARIDLYRDGVQATYKVLEDIPGMAILFRAPMVQMNKDLALIGTMMKNTPQRDASRAQKKVKEDAR